MKRNWSSPSVSVLQRTMCSVHVNTTVFACLAIVVNESRTQSWYDEGRRSPAVQPWLQEDQRGSLLEGKGSPPSSSEGIPCEFCGESFPIAYLYSHQVKQNPVLSPQLHCLIHALLVYLPLHTAWSPVATYV